MTREAMENGRTHPVDWLAWGVQFLYEYLKQERGVHTMKIYKARIKTDINVSTYDGYLIHWSDNEFTLTNHDDGDAYTKEFWNSVGINDEYAYFESIEDNEELFTNDRHKSLASMIVGLHHFIKEGDLDKIDSVIADVLKRNDLVI